PRTFAQEIEAVVAASRLREVIAFIGFARIEAPDSGVLDDIDAARSRVAIAEKGPFWVPAAEVRGEGVFVRLPEHRLVPWVAHAEQSERMRALRARHEQRSKRPWPGARYVLLHSLAHALINETALECGYSAASIRERIYASEPSADAEAMAGILLYTAAPDAEGTLGGLVSLAEPDTMERLLSCMLARADICASDPLCAEHLPSDQEAALHGAACHACLLIPETSCEIGNRYLDRATLVGTVISSGIGYFR
ncbi:MAG: DrmB family protein, partial [Vulcanimicrobiaceae bacterium]